LPIYGTRFAGATLSRLRVIQTGDLPVSTESEANETAATVSRPGQDAPGTFFRSVPPLRRMANTRRECILPPDTAAYLRPGSGCGYIS
jgi:hypothetical protein